MRSQLFAQADRADTGTPEDLQKATTDYLKKRHPETVVEEVVETVTSAVHKVADKVSELAPSSSAEKDEVEGPLGRKK